MEIVERLRERLSSALSRLPSQFRRMLLSIGVDELPVPREERPDEIVTMISKRDIIDYYYGRSTL